jgi:hypothetical protein
VCVLGLNTGPAATSVLDRGDRGVAREDEAQWLQASALGEVMCAGKWESGPVHNRYSRNRRIFGKESNR